MSILINGMEMPTSCAYCPAYRFGCTMDGDCWNMCAACGKDLNNPFGIERPDWCPLVEIPPHDGEAFEKVISERISQTEKWGNNPCNHPFEWMSILGEEYGELCEAVNETCFMNGKHPERGGAENIVREAAQIAAVAIAIIRDFSPAIIEKEGEK